MQLRGVAQLGSALRSGRRGRRFKSCHPDHVSPSLLYFAAVLDGRAEALSRQDSSCRHAHRSDSPSRPRAPVTDRTTRHHGRYRWNPSPDARECAPSHRRRPGAARSFSAATSPVPRTVPLAQGVPEPKTSCRSSLDPAAVSTGIGIYRVRGRNGEPCLVAANSSTLLRGMLPLPQTSSKGIALTASSRTWSGPRRRETSASPPGSGSPSCPAR